jgi:quinol monooxygenase YgiN
MIIVKGTARFGAGKLDGLREALAANIEATRREKGCLAYHYGVDVTDPDLLIVSEQWEDEAAIDAHMAAPHMAELMGAIGPAIEAISIKAYEARHARTLLGE